MRRGQAALEFLTTYGWAFLVILIVIGALAYFGILSPAKFLPSRCNFGSEIICEDYQISGSTNAFSLRLKNGIGKPIVIDTIILGSEGSTVLSCTQNYNANGTMRPWKASNISDFAWTACNSVAAGFSPVGTC